MDAQIGHLLMLLPFKENASDLRKGMWAPLSCALWLRYAILEERPSSTLVHTWSGLDEKAVDLVDPKVLQTP